MLLTLVMIIFRFEKFQVNQIILLRSFQTSFEIIKKYKLKKFINGPIN